MGDVLTTTFSKPELGQATQGAIRQVYLESGPNKPDIAVIKVRYDSGDGTLAVTPFDLKKLKDGTNVRPGQVKLGVSYPVIYTDGEKKLVAVNEGEVTETNRTVKVTVGDYTQTIEGMALYKATVGPGSSGSFIYEKDQSGEIVATGIHITSFEQEFYPNGTERFSQAGGYSPFTQETIDWITQVVERESANIF